MLRSALKVLFPCNPDTERGSSTKLHVSKDGKLVYANGRTVVIRDLKDASIAKVYSGHSRNVTVAKFSPSGYYCASADITGTVRVWDTVGEENILKGEYPAISGKVNDLAWDGESKRIIAVGDGREIYGKAFMFDTGSSTGEISGHSKVANAVSIRHQRPFKAVTASDDCSIVFHSGVPFKYEKTISTHTKFVQDVQFSLTGDHFASVGSDTKVFLYDGKTGDSLGEFTGAGHKGSVMACSWAPDSKTVTSSSMDGTVKLWDIEKKQMIQSWTVGTGVTNQQVGNAWSADGDIVSLSMSGVLNIFDQRVGDKPARYLGGAQKSITTATLAPSGTFFAGTTDGRIVSYDLGTGDAEFVSGKSHTAHVGSVISAREGVLSVGYDDMLREVSGDGKSMTAAATKLNAQPKSMATSDEGTTFIAVANSIEAFRSNQRVTQLPISYEPHAVSTTGKLVAVGGADNKVHLYSWNGTELKESGVLDGPRSVVTAVAFSPDGSLLAAGDSTGKIILIDVTEKKAIESRWTHHSSRIYSLAWSSAGKHIASGSLDTNVYIWSIDKPLAYVTIKNAGPSGVNSVVWLDDDVAKGRVASAGADGCVRVWEITL